MRVLVTAASKHGATAEIAEAIAEEIREGGVDADHRDPGDVQGLEGYGALVIGSAAYMGHWLDDARRLVERIAPGLGGRPVWLFSSGPIGDPPKPGEEPEEVARLVEVLDARDHAVFAGRIDRSLLGPIEKTLVTVMHIKDTDDRDWDAIGDWARGIADQLKSSDSPA